MQKVDGNDFTEITVRDDERGNGRVLFSITFDDTGPRSCGGQLFVELGTGERVKLEVPTRLFDEIYCLGRRHGLAEKAAE